MFALVSAVPAVYVPLITGVRQLPGAPLKLNIALGPVAPPTVTENVHTPPVGPGAKLVLPAATGVPEPTKVTF